MTGGPPVEDPMAIISVRAGKCRILAFTGGSAADLGVLCFAIRLTTLTSDINFTVLTSLAAWRSESG